MLVFALLYFHFASLVLFFQDVAANPNPYTLLAGKVLGVATAVFAILQTLKKVIPVSGTWSVVLNAALSIVGMIITFTPEQLLTAPVLLSLAVAILAAAGIHGSWVNWLKPLLGIGGDQGQGVKQSNGTSPV